jgi:hypothetical protein
MLSLPLHVCAWILQVNTMIQQASRTSAAANPPATAAGGDTAPTPQQQQQQQVLPLIRLRVDYTGFGTVNSQRFGQKYVGKVANPHDMLLWAKAAARRVKEQQREADEEALAAGLGLTSFRPEQLEQVTQTHIHTHSAGGMPWTIRVWLSSSIEAQLCGP